MGIKEYIPGTKARQDMRQELVVAEWERAEAERNRIIQQTKETWIARNREHYEEERAALERVLAYKAALIDTKEPEKVGRQQFRFAVAEGDDYPDTACFVQQNMMADIKLYIVHNEWPFEKVTARLRPVDSPEVLATQMMRRHEPTQDRGHHLNNVIKSHVLGYQLDIQTTTLLDSVISSERHADLSVMAEALDEYFGPLPDDQAA